jgi:hypothetical protein
VEDTAQEVVAEAGEAVAAAGHRGHEKMRIARSGPIKSRWDYLGSALHRGGRHMCGFFMDSNLEVHSVVLHTNSV